jgi:hypothetical protein
LFSFPNEDRLHERKCWIKAVNRKNPSNPSNVRTPNPDSRICSIHFVDNKPTSKNPYPTLSLGHIQSIITPRKPQNQDKLLFTAPLQRKKQKYLSILNIIQRKKILVLNPPCRHVILKY